MSSCGVDTDGIVADIKVLTNRLLCLSIDDISLSVSQSGLPSTLSSTAVAAAAATVSLDRAQLIYIQLNLPTNHPLTLPC